MQLRIIHFVRTYSEVIKIRQLKSSFVSHMKNIKLIFIKYNIVLHKDKYIQSVHSKSLSFCLISNYKRGIK